MMAEKRGRDLSGGHGSEVVRSVETVLNECFWGDYNLSVDDILQRLDQGDEGFSRFLFSRIIENSRRPSKHLAVLFSPEHLRLLLDRYGKQCRDPERFAVIRGNITGEYVSLPGLAWKR